MTYRDLEIIWDQEWQPGVLLFGVSDLPLHSVDSLMPGEAVRRFELYGPRWHITGHSVHLPVWPSADRWPTLVAHALEELVRRGAVVAWLGAEEGCLATPPSLFDSRAMAGCVLAFHTAEGEQHQVGRLDEPVTSIGDAELARIHQRVADLLDDNARVRPAIWHVLAAEGHGAEWVTATARTAEVVGKDPARRAELVTQIDRVLATGLDGDHLGALLNEQVPGYELPANAGNHVEWLREVRAAAAPDSVPPP